MESLLSLGALDWSVIAVYFAGVFAVAFMLNAKSNKNSSDDYFLAGRNLGWFLVGASLFASNICSEHLIGLAGTGASSGMAVGQFEILACFMLLLLGWFFVPFYIRTGVTTMPEFLEHRFSEGARNYLTFISVFGYVLTKISVTIYAGAVVFEAIGVDFWVGAIVVVVATGIYTIFGGLRAVIYTDAVQMVLMLVGSILITVLGLKALGGLGELQSSLSADFFDMWKPMTDKDFPWTGILFGAPILGVWYWCTDQYVVQRTLSARNIQQARRGSIFAGFLKILPLFLFVVPGMICLALENNNQLTLTNADTALPTLAAFVLPSGLKGLFIAGLLAALMSSLSSAFNSCSTLVTYDVFKKYKPDLSEAQLVRFGKFVTVILVVVGIVWIPVIERIAGGVYKYIQSVQAYISPPVAAVFLLGLLWKRINSWGAQAALYTGFVFGVFRLYTEIIKDTLTVDSMLYHYSNMNFLHFALCLFIFCSSIMIIVSLLSPEQEDIEHLTFNWQRFMDLSKEKGFGLDVVLSIALTLCVFIVWWVFS